MSALCGLLGMVVVSMSGDVERLKNPGLYYLIPLGFALLFLGGPFLEARRQYRKQQYLREPLGYDFTNDGIGLTGPNFSSKIAWTLVRRVYETKTLFLIYQSSQLAWILPKHFFCEESAIEGGKSFVIGHLTKPSLFHGCGWVASWF